jgi:signal transduction histidine kinase
MSILGIVQLAKLEENLTLEYLNIIETNILKLDEFIKNIIKYYQNSRSDELLEKIDFKQLLSAEIDMLRNIDSSVTFETDIVETGDFVGDYFRIRLVINNLISNAIKYRDSGKTNHIVNIQINTNQKEANIKVIDNGVGMAEEHLGNIFKMFYRAQSTSSKQGSGIGLFIVKESLEKIGGSITVNSTQGKGTEFEVLIPNKTA